ncbi:hypothetical protein BDZ89DRAFT_1038897 [Hymenopellis radicata]|nr:hypothetical protein BDZ89DRAFT_1038897 [Hymenopellis radicata]
MASPPAGSPSQSDHDSLFSDDNFDVDATQLDDWYAELYHTRHDARIAYIAALVWYRDTEPQVLILRAYQDADGAGHICLADNIDHLRRIPLSVGCSLERYDHGEQAWVRCRFNEFMDIDLTRWMALKAEHINHIERWDMVAQIGTDSNVLSHCSFEKEKASFSHPAPPGVPVVLPIVPVDYDFFVHFLRMRILAVQYSDTVIYPVCLLMARHQPRQNPNRAEQHQLLRLEIRQALKRLAGKRPPAARCRCRECGMVLLPAFYVGTGPSYMTDVDSLDHEYANDLGRWRACGRDRWLGDPKPMSVLRRSSRLVDALARLRLLQNGVRRRGFRGPYPLGDRRNNSISLDEEDDNDTEGSAPPPVSSSSTAVETPPREQGADLRAFEASPEPFLPRNPLAKRRALNGTTLKIIEVLFWRQKGEQPISLFFENLQRGGNTATIVDNRLVMSEPGGWDGDELERFDVEYGVWRECPRTQPINVSVHETLALRHVGVYVPDDFDGHLADIMV